MTTYYLVSLDRVRAWVNVGHSLDDTKLDFMRGAASAAVMDYVGLSPSDLELDSDGEQVYDSDGNPGGVSPVEAAATAVLVQLLYDGLDPAELEYGRLPIEVTSMLYVRRREMGFA